MLSRELGKSGIQVSAVGVGTWAVGGTMWGGTDESGAVEAIRRALDGGVNLIDTAPIYGFGLADRLIARAMEGRTRDSVVIATKVGLNWESTEGKPHFTVEGRKVRINLRPEAMRRQLEDTLDRLGTDHVDLLQINLPDPTTPIEDTVSALLDLMEEGKARAVGVSNASVEQMGQYLATGFLDAHQGLFNMLDRELEREVLPFCRERRIAVLAYSPLAQGLLTGRVTEARAFAEGDLRARNPRFRGRKLQAVRDLLEALAPLRESAGLSPAQFAVAWAINQPGVTSALVGLRDADQADEALGAARELPREVLDAARRTLAAEVAV